MTGSPPLASYQVAPLRRMVTSGEQLAPGRLGEVGEILASDPGGRQGRARPTR